MISIIIIGWVICSLICYMIVETAEPDSTEDEKVSTMAMCFCVWWLLLLVIIGEAVLKFLTKICDWLRGFLVGLFRKDGKRNDDYYKDNRILPHS